MTNVAQLKKFLEQFPDDTIVHVVDAWENGKFDGNAEPIELQLVNPDGNANADHWDYYENQKILVLGIPS